MTWQTVDTSASGSTERLKIEQGWLYRSAWRINMGIGTDMLSGSDITFVPAVHPAVVKPNANIQAQSLAQSQMAEAQRQDALHRAQAEGDLRRAQAQANERRAAEGATGSPPPTATAARVNPTPAQSTLSPDSPSGPTGTHQDAPAVREDDKASPVPSPAGATGSSASGE